MKEARQVERGALIVRLPGRALTTRAHLEFLFLALQAIRSPKAATPPRRISPRRGPFFCRGLSPRHSLGSFGGRGCLFGILLRRQSPNYATEVRPLPSRFVVSPSAHVPNIEADDVWKVRKAFASAGTRYARCG